MEETDPSRMSSSGILELDGPPPPPPQPVGVYGWRKRCLYTSVLVLMISVVVNIALTVWIIRVLHFSWDGMGRLKLNSGGFTLNGEAEFLKTIYVDKLRNKKKPLYIHSNQQVQLSSKRKSTEGSRIVIDNQNIEATCDTFHVRDLQNNTQMLINGSKVSLGFPDVHVPGPVRIKGSIKVPSIISQRGKTLNITAMSSKVLIYGLGGVSMRSTVDDITLQAEDDIKIKSSRAIKLDSEDLILTGLKKASNESSSVYQLCVCFDGALFLGDPGGNCRDAPDHCTKSKP